MNNRTVEWSWAAWGVTVAAVAASGAIAWGEGTLTRLSRARVDMGFLDHGGMWSDALLLAVFNAIVVPHVSWHAWFAVPGALALALTLVMHRAWWSPTGSCRDHLWPARSRDGKTWASSLSRAGWAHVVYMTAQLTLILVFLISRLPAAVVAAGSMMLAVHVAIGLLQPHWFCTGRKWNPAAAGPLTIALGGVALSAVVKLL